MKQPQNFRSKKCHLVFCILQDLKLITARIVTSERLLHMEIIDVSFPLLSCNNPCWMRAVFRDQKNQGHKKWWPGGNGNMKKGHSNLCYQGQSIESPTRNAKKTIMKKPQWASNSRNSFHSSSTKHPQNGQMSQVRITILCLSKLNIHNLKVHQKERKHKYTPIHPLAASAIPVKNSLSTKPKPNQLNI